MYYAANNQYATDTSVGFGNTWYVLAFVDKKSRDQYVKDAKGLAVCAINRKDIPGYIKAPKPFSGLKRAITSVCSNHVGLIGEVSRCTTNDANYVCDL